MAYVKHTWRTGEIIKAEYMNNIENGILNEETRAINSEGVLDDKINANRSRCDDGIETESIRATTAEEELSGVEWKSYSAAYDFVSDLREKKETLNPYVINFQKTYETIFSRIVDLLFEK